MAASSVGNINCDVPKAGVKVTRFTRPDVRQHLYDREAIEECALYRELDAAALSSLAAGETIIINLGLIDWFPTAFYRFLLKVRETVGNRKALLRLCCLTPNVKECFDLMGGGKVFESTATEAQAVATGK